MTDWLLVIAVAGVTSFNGVTVTRVSEAQCLAAIKWLITGSGIAAVCIGPKGETVVPVR